MFSLMWHFMVWPFTLLFKMTQFFIFCFFALDISIFMAAIAFPFYGIYTIIKIISKSRERRKGMPKRSRGLRILFATGRVIWWLLLFGFLFFHLIYLVFRIMLSGAYEKRPPERRKDDLSWIDRLEEYDALFN